MGLGTSSLRRSTVRAIRPTVLLSTSTAASSRTQIWSSLEAPSLAPAVFTLPYPCRENTLPERGSSPTTRDTARGAGFLSPHVVRAIGLRSEIDATGKGPQLA